MLPQILCGLILLSLLIVPIPARAEVYLAQDEALEIAFPEADQVLPLTHVLTDQQAQEIEALSHSKVESRIPILFKGVKNGQIIGFAFFDTHRVRTHTETVMIVIEKGGKVEKTVVLAFHEPPDYMASERWLGQFNSMSEPDRAKIGSGVVGIVGSTLTSQAIAAAVRRALAEYAVLKLGN